MLSPRTNRRPLTRLARLATLGAVALVAILVAGLQVATAVEQEPTEVSRTAGATVTIDIEELEAMAAALDGRLQPVLDHLRNVLTDPESGNRRIQLTFTVRSQPDETAGLSTELGDDILEALAALPQPDAPADPSNAPVRIGDGVAPPRKIHDVPPVYPPAAREAGVQGLVILDATIDPTGVVGDIEVLKSVPELDEAAIAAVEQWRYEPTLVDGVPVPISMTMTINFTLSSR